MSTRENTNSNNTTNQHAPHHQYTDHSTGSTSNSEHQPQDETSTAGKQSVLQTDLNVPVLMELTLLLSAGIQKAISQRIMNIPPNGWRRLMKSWSLSSRMMIVSFTDGKVSNFRCPRQYPSFRQENWESLAISPNITFLPSTSQIIFWCKTLLCC